jgi:hypothetical protein
VASGPRPGLPMAAIASFMGFSLSVDQATPAPPRWALSMAQIFSIL